MKEIETTPIQTTCAEFLRDVKNYIVSGKKDFIKRTYRKPDGSKVKWIEALMDIGLTKPEQAWHEVLDLTPDDYQEGPILDFARPDEGKVIWVFKKEVNSTLTYIKLKIDNRRGCVCLSFHEDW